jgi:ferritin-like metal-binding protein YciE
MSLKSLDDLFVDELRDLFSAENQLIKALPKMAKAATSAELRTGFQKHLEQTKKHAERLEQIIDRLDANPRGKKCKAMEGLIEEGKELMEARLCPFGAESEEGPPHHLHKLAQSVQMYTFSLVSCSS